MQSAMQELVAEYNELYAEIDRELKLYAQKANDNDPTSDEHLVRVDELTAKAHEVTAQMSAIACVGGHP